MIGCICIRCCCISRTLFIYMYDTRSLARQLVLKYKTFSLQRNRGVGRGAERETAAPACKSATAERNKSPCFLSGPAFTLSYSDAITPRKILLFIGQTQGERREWWCLFALLCFGVEVEATWFDLALSSLQWGHSLELRVLFSLQKVAHVMDEREGINLTKDAAVEN